MHSGKYDYQSLVDKRDGLRIKIRKEKHNKIIAAKRWLILNPDAEALLLRDINVPEVVHFLRSQRFQFPQNVDALEGEAYTAFLDEMNELKTHLTNLTTYATSTRFDHVFEFFSEELVDQLLELAEKLYCANTKNEVILENAAKMFNGLVWTLCNYIGSGKELCSGRYLQLMIHALGNPNQTMKGNILASLGSLSEQPHFLQLMLRADVIPMLFSDRVPKDAAVYFLMKGLQNIEYKDYRPYLQQIVKLLLEELYDQRITLKRVKNVFQSLGCIFTHGHIGRHPNIVLKNFEEVEAILSWLLKKQPFEKAEQQKKYEQYLPKVLAIVDNLYTADVQQPHLDAYIQYLEEGLLPKTVELLNMYLCSPRKEVRIKANIILESICVTEELVAELFYRHFPLVSHVLMTLSSQKSGEEPFEVKRSCINAICNICIVADENDIKELVFKHNLLPVLRERLNEYEDAEINLKLLGAMDRLFDIGQIEQTEKDLYSNRMADFFLSAGGEIPLTQLLEHNSPEVAEAAARIHDIYFTSPPSDKLQSEP